MFQTYRTILTIISKLTSDLNYTLFFFIKFTAPVEGIYSFSFHGLTQDGTATYVKLVHRKADEENWENVAGTYRIHEKEDEEQESPVGIIINELSSLK